MTGTIKKLVYDRGFGFITGEDGQDVFFHLSGVEHPLLWEELEVADRVAFDTEPSQRGPRAVRVRPAP